MPHSNNVCSGLPILALYDFDCNLSCFARDRSMHLSREIMHFFQEHEIL